MPSQVDEEAHQLSYLQKHLANIVSLLAEPVEGEGEESLVCKMTLSNVTFGFSTLFIFMVKVATCFLTESVSISAKSLLYA